MMTFYSVLKLFAIHSVLLCVSAVSNTILHLDHIPTRCNKTTCFSLPQYQLIWYIMAYIVKAAKNIYEAHS